MGYAVKEIFYTLQGEGANTGRAAVFLRFSGCNLWSGRESDRSRGPGGCAMWCDTDFLGVDGEQGGRYGSPEELADIVARTFCPDGSDARRFVVCTGGEPLLQLDEPLVHALRARGFAIAIETNGTQPLPCALDWVCVSPKAGGALALHAGDELKLAFPQTGMDPASFEHLSFRHFFLTPIDGPARDTHTRLAVDYCLNHPRWRLCLQTHKLLGIP